MSEWSSKIKKLFHLQRHNEEQITKGENVQQLQKKVQKEAEQKSESFFKFDIDNLFKRTKNNPQKPSISQLLFPQTNSQPQDQISSNNNNKQTLTKNSPHSKIKQSQMKLNHSNLNENQDQNQDQNENENEYGRDDDEDSLGYTENEWDEQTINFQLQDRMLDCLQDEKHLSLYRQSLILNNDIRKKAQQRLTKPNNSISGKDNQVNEIQFESILNQKNLDSQPSLSSKKSIHQVKVQKKRQRKNRFSKYKKVNQNNQLDRRSLVAHLTPQEEQKLDRVYKQKLKELKSKGNQTCDDYITRVFNTKIYSTNQLNSNKQSNNYQPSKQIENINKHKEKQQNKNQSQVKQNDISQSSQKQQQKNQVQSTEQNKKQSINQVQLINYPIDRNGADQMLKKQSMVSNESFQVVEEKNHISLQQIHKMSSHSSQNSLKDIHQIQSTHNKSNQDNELEIKNVVIWGNKVQTKDHLRNENYNNESQSTEQNEQKNKIMNNQSNAKNINQDNQNNHISQRLFHVLSPPRSKPISPFNHSPEIQTQTIKPNDHSNINPFNHQKPLYTQLSPNSKNQQFTNSLNLQPFEHSQIPISHSPIKITQQGNRNPFLRVNNSPQNYIPIKIQGSPDIRFNAGKSPRAKIEFNYLNQQTPNNNQMVNFVSSATNTPELPKTTPYPLKISPKKTNIQNHPRILYIAPQPEERIPIFLQRLRRLISAYPNFYSTKTDIDKVQNDLKTILNGMRSAISVIELLYKKLKIQRSRLQQPLLKMEECKNLGQKQFQMKKRLQGQIWDFFINSSWQCYKIEEIEYIKPKQKFKKRKLNVVNLDEALRMYNDFTIFYLNEPILTAKTQDQIQRYIRIRQKISSIVQNLRMISEDLYTFWLVQCHYPFIYYEFLHFLKQDHVKTSFTNLCDQIYAKLVLAEQYKDPLSSSIIGSKILEKIQNMCF